MPERREARLVSKVTPVYPRQLLAARLGGELRLVLTVDEQGRVTEARPIGGRSLLSREAIAAAMQWRYEPATIGGSPVASEVVVLVTFTPVRREP